MDKFSFISLWDAYNGLLTRTQQEITDLYFNKDLTVTEIAEQKGISRQAVSECLTGCKKQLEEYEEKSFLRTDAGMWAEGFKSAHPEFTEDIERLDGILKYDYSEKAEERLKNP